MRLERRRTSAAGESEMDAGRQAAAAQHQESRKSLLQANRAEWYVASGTSDRTADIASLGAHNAASARLTLSDAQQSERSWKRQKPKRKSHDQQGQRGFDGAAPLLRRQGEEARDCRHQSSLTIPCSAMRANNAWTSPT